MVEVFSATDKQRNFKTSMQEYLCLNRNTEILLVLSQYLACIQLFIFMNMQGYVGNGKLYDIYHMPLLVFHAIYPLSISL